MNNNGEINALLERKYLESTMQLSYAHKSGAWKGKLEYLMLLCLLILFLMVLHFVFWGAGFQSFARAQHDYSMRHLASLPGEQSALIPAALQRDGYISLIDYRRYVAMAKAAEQEAKSARKTDGHYSASAFQSER